jgi:uncharacterized protein (DUF427 family)
LARAQQLLILASARRPERPRGEGASKQGLVSLNHPSTNPVERLKTMKAIWNGVVLAESDKTIVVENNHYFPPEALKPEYFKESATHTTCPWKGEASYYTVAVNGQANPDAAWYYPQPKSAAARIAGYVAFWRGVKVEE